MRAVQDKYGLLHNTYKTEYTKEGFAIYKCGKFHNGVEFITHDRKAIRKHIMREHYNYKYI